MRVPKELLRDSISVLDYGGSGAHGPLYAAPRSVRASVQPTQHDFTDSRGVTVTVNTLAIIRPEDGPVPVESRVTAEGITYRVMQCYAMPDTRRPSHYELALARLGA